MKDDDTIAAPSTKTIVMLSPNPTALEHWNEAAAVEQNKRQVLAGSAYTLF
jgi:hypothetical protein